MKFDPDWLDSTIPQSEYKECTFIERGLYIKHDQIKKQKKKKL